LLIAISVLVGTAPLDARGREPPDTSIHRGFLCPRVIRASPIWPDGRGGLLVHLAVIHQDQQDELFHDSQTYPLSNELAERLEEDFGEFAPLALSRVEQSLLALPLPLVRPDLERTALTALLHIWRHLPFRVLPDVTLSQNTELWINRLATTFYRRKGQPLLITSGTRTPEQQAAAMYRKLSGRGRYRSLYRKRELAEEIRRVYISGRRARHSRAQIIDAMASLIRHQMEQGRYVSAHLRRVAADVRSWGMTRSVRRALRRVVASFPGMRLIREKRPPHYHLELPEEPALRISTCAHLAAEATDLPRGEDPPP
jgi:hypothetical protein